uniref:Uncharacterized protein n=1 Tax=Magallana gigas TaxID=29159 RepID=K1QC32_MAGGI
MEVLSLIKSSLGSEDSNPIHRLYRVGQQVGVCGQENVWRIHEAESIEEEKILKGDMNQSGPQWKPFRFLSNNGVGNKGREKFEDSKFCSPCQR